MGREIVYCGKCSDRILPEEFDLETLHYAFEPSFYFSIAF